LENKVEVKFSAIHGNGIFAAKDLSENEIIMVIEGEVIDEKECIRREEEEKNVYIFWNGDNYIDTANTSVIKYINHHCEPNCKIGDKDENSLYLIAARNIPEDEELTIDYGYDEIYDNCNCSVCADSMENGKSKMENF